MIPVLSLDMEHPLEFVEKYGTFEHVKLGHNLAMEGRKILDELFKKGLKVILDLKFVDIPSTVERSIRSWDHPCVIGFTVHSACGIDAVRAALGATNKRIFVVIKLTSIPGDLDDYIEMIEKFDDLGTDFVMPGKWARKLRTRIKGKFLVPGIRMEAAVEDQKDVVTLEDVRGIADYVVLGREVYRSADPALKIKKIKELIGCWNS